jgi:amidase
LLGEDKAKVALGAPAPQMGQADSLPEPTLADIARAATDLQFSLSGEEIAVYRRLVAEMLPSYSRLRQLRASHTVPSPVARQYRWPTEDDNPYGAWYCRTEIEPLSDGPLAGKTVALKDNIAVAGIPMTIGSRLLDGYVADVDATVVTRVLQAGGTIAGKAVCEALCLSGGSHTSDSGPVRNPHDPNRAAGGSSSGNAALLAARAVDMGIGGDQGGSIRIPSSWCGVYGLKPTYGLVPYTGIVSLDLTLDHAGPMARTVEDVALLLDAIAGPDGIDHRQYVPPPHRKYSDSLRQDLSGVRLGVLKEGFGWPNVSQPDVDEAVRDAAYAFQKLGCTVKPISIPWHLDGYHIHTGILAEGCLMAAQNAAGTNWKGTYLTSLIEAYSRGLEARADGLPDNVKHFWLTGRYIQEAYHGVFYAIARNLSSTLSAAYTEALRDCDLLVMPTTTYKAEPLPAANATLEERIARTGGMEFNLCPFDVTGHPAMNVPCAISEGLPVGMMLVGRLDEDATVLRAAIGFEHNVYSPRPPVRA